MTWKEDVEFVAEKARETFMKIKEVRKKEPQFTRVKKNELENEIKQLQDQWWEEVKEKMKKLKEGK